MMYGDGLLALLGVCAFSLFAARKLGLNAGLLPLPVMAGSALWLCFFGMAGQLVLGGWLWFGLAALALAGLLLAGAGKNGLKAALAQNGRDALARAAVPGFVFFAAAGLFFWLLFAVTQPMFIRWDEFTFWGTACRMTKEADMLHTVAPGNMSARSYLPGMMLISYLFQFFGPAFSEWKCFAAYNTLAAAVFAAFGAEEKRRWPTAVLCLAGAVLLPYFFVAPGDDSVYTIYLTVMGDLSLGLVFGGALCLYFRCGEKKRGLVLAGLSLLLLTLIKDMGFAYALIAAALMAADRLVYPRLSLKGLGRAVGSGLCMAVPVAGLYLGWSRYVLAAAGIDKNVVGSSEKSYGYLEMFLDGFRQLLGSGDPEMAEKFRMVLGLTANALIKTPLSLIGSTFMVLAMLGGVFALAFFFAPGGQRRRPVVFFGLSLAAFGAFVAFHLLLYVYSFSMREASILKDFERYMAPFLMGWVLAGLCLLLALGRFGARPRLSQAGCIAACGAVALVFCLRGVPTAGFWNYPATNYAEREDVRYRASLINDALDWEDEVFLISQGDDGTRWYYYAYELNARLAYGYGGESYIEEADSIWNTVWNTTSVSLVNAKEDPWYQETYAFQNEYEYTAKCTVEDLIAFLRDKGYSHILMDQSDKYIFYEFGPYFTARFPIERGDAAYLFKIVDDGAEMRFEPEGEVRYEPKDD
ncbi:MAG: hypothetical protein IIV90_01155 [Oscillospiraceae bacterium]|nr:hypothetical protein [Oscillospiraceae bacterium]